MMTQKMARRASVFMRIALAFSSNSVPPWRARRPRVSRDRPSHPAPRARRTKPASRQPREATTVLCARARVHQALVRERAKRDGGVANRRGRPKPLAQRRGKSPLVPPLGASRAARARAHLSFVIFQIDHHVQHQTRATGQSPALAGVVAETGDASIAARG